MEKKKSRKGLVIVLLVIAILIAVIPFLALKGAEFGGSDDARAARWLPKSRAASIRLGLNQFLNSIWEEKSQAK